MRRSVRCRVSTAFVRRGIGMDRLSLPLRRHAVACPNCAYEAARWAEIREGLARLRFDVRPAPVEVTASVIRRMADPLDAAHVGDETPRDASRGPAIPGRVALPLAAAGVAAVAVGIGIWRRRARLA